MLANYSKWTTPNSLIESRIKQQKMNFVYTKATKVDVKNRIIYTEVENNKRIEQIYIYI